MDNRCRVLVLLMAAILSGCGTEGGPVGTQSVTNLSELAEKACSVSNAGELVLVTSTGQQYACANTIGGWSWIQSVSTLAEAGDCTNLNAANLRYVVQDASVYQCIPTQWLNVSIPVVSSSSSTQSSDIATLLELMAIPCSAENALQTKRVTELNENYLCFLPSELVTQGAWIPMVSSVSALATCNSLTVGKSYYVSQASDVYVCDGTAWTALGFSIAVSSSSVILPISSGVVISSSVHEGSSAQIISSASSATKVVDFEEGVIWIPAYGLRARTFFNTVDEYSFWSPNTETNDSSGWWEKYSDAVELGSSVVTGTFESNNLSLSIDLQYVGWHLASDGMYTYNAPNPYPYGGFQFPLSPVRGGYADLSTWTGVCVTYTASARVAFAVRSALTDLGDGMHWEAILPASSSRRTAEINFSQLTRSQYASTVVTRAAAIQTATGFQIAYRNDEAQITCPSTYSPASCFQMGYSAQNQINIFKIAKAGMCASAL